VYPVAVHSRRTVGLGGEKRRQVAVSSSHHGRAQNDEGGAVWPGHSGRTLVGSLLAYGTRLGRFVVLTHRTIGNRKGSCASIATLRSKRDQRAGLLVRWLLAFWLGHPKHTRYLGPGLFVGALRSPVTRFIALVTHVTRSARATCTHARTVSHVSRSEGEQDRPKRELSPGSDG
jgi:hypothetical protein